MQKDQEATVALDDVEEELLATSQLDNAEIVPTRLPLLAEESVLVETVARWKGFDVNLVVEPHLRAS